jgi:hypothetical protein
VANVQFEQLCDRFAKVNPTWIAELRKKREHYLAFLKYPEYMRKSFSTTNVVEAINGQLEILRRNSGGYFHSQDTPKFKLGIAVTGPENGKWRVANHRIHSVLPQLNQSFRLDSKVPYDSGSKHNFIDKSPGGTDGRPVSEYICSNFGDNSFNVSSTIFRIGRSG